jgi:hypothetical protein
MKDRTNRRLLIIFGLFLLLSIGAVAIGFLGIVDLLDSGVLATALDWIEPLISIRSDGLGPDTDQSFQAGPSAMELEATRLAEQQDSITAIYEDWPTVFEEAFVVNNVDWPEFSEADDLARLEVQIVDGKYRWVAQANDGFVWWSYPDMDSLTDFFAEVEVIQTEGDPYGEMGMIFRVDQDRFYLYEVSGEYFTLWRNVADGWETLIDWTTAEDLRSGAMNRLGILAVGDQFYLFINDQLVAQLRDSQYQAGVVGLAIGLEEAGDLGTFEFDNLLIKAP